MSDDRRRLVAGLLFGGLGVFSLITLGRLGIGLTQLYIVLHSQLSPTEPAFHPGYLPRNEDVDLHGATYTTVDVPAALAWSLGPLAVLALAWYVDPLRGRNWLGRAATLLVLVLILCQLFLTAVALRFL